MNEMAVIQARTILTKLERNYFKYFSNLLKLEKMEVDSDLEIYAKHLN